VRHRSSRYRVVDLVSHSTWPSGPLPKSCPVIGQVVSHRCPFRRGPAAGPVSSEVGHSALPTFRPAARWRVPSSTGSFTRTGRLAAPVCHNILNILAGNDVFFKGISRVLRDGRRRGNSFPAVPQSADRRPRQRITGHLLAPDHPIRRRILRRKISAYRWPRGPDKMECREEVAAKGVKLLAGWVDVAWTR